MQSSHPIKNTAAYLLFLLVLTGFNAAAQSISGVPGYIFSSYTVADGLPSSEVICTATDKKGFLWAGTANGLSRYDGYTFTNFTYSADEHFVGVVHAIKVDDAGKIWVAANSGLYCFRQNKLMKISAEAGNKKSVNDIVTEANGSLWLATDNGPVYIESPAIDITGLKKVTLTNYVLQAWKNKYDVAYPSRCDLIKKAQDGTVYFSQAYNIFRVINFQPQLIYTISAANDNTEFILPVSRSKIFYSNARTGLHKIENGKDSLYQFKNIYQPGRKPVTEGKWYVGSLGLVCFHPQEEFISESISFNEAGAQWLTAVNKENDLLWLSSHSGLVKIKTSLFQLYNQSKYNEVEESFSLLQLQKGSLLIGVNHGKIYEFNEDGVKDFLPGIKQPVRYAEIKTMYEDKRGWLWMGTGYQGIAVYKNGVTTRFTAETNNLHDNSFYSFLPAGNGKIFAIGDKGLTEITVDEKLNIFFKPIFSRPAITQFAKFYGGIIAPGGTAWMAGEEGLRYLQKDSLLPFELTKKNISISDIKMAADGSVWIATNGQGVYYCRFNEKEKLEIIKQYTEKDGLNTLQFLCLLVDKDDNVWAGSAKGLSFIGRNEKYKSRLVNFTAADGFIKPGYYSMKLYQDKNERIWAGTSLGLASFMPEKLFINTSPPKVYITGIDFLNRQQTAALTDYGITENNSQVLTLPYLNNALNFNYTAIDQTAPSGIQYYYRMQGLDTSWIQAGIQRSATYHNLAPGSYTFSVKAVNQKGQWSKGYVSYSFVIKPPFWKTWWFILLILFTTAAIGIMFVRRRIDFIRKTEAQKTEIQKIKADSYQAQLEAEQVTGFFTGTIHQHNNIDELLWDVAKNLIGKLNFEECMIYLWNSDKTILLQRAGYGLKGDMQVVQNKEGYNIAKGKGIVGAAAESGHYVLVNDTSKDSRYFSADEKIMFSELSVPILQKGEVTGVINTEHSKKKFFTDKHVKILTTIASLCADKIEKIKAEQQTREKEMELLKMNRDLATSQLTALRAQMNPHFIFNAMNSIQQFTLKNEVDNANLYLSRFSILLRKVLQSSQQNFITLEDEMSLLNLYLDIEKLRLGNDFIYTIDAAEELEQDAVKIPGMLVQPFVENAVKHGLALKEGIKKLDIFFSLSDESTLLVTVTDNGIGMQKAKELKAQNDKLLPHESKGIALVEQRIQLLAPSGEAPKICIEAIAGPDGNATGTKVSLTVPLLLNTP